VSQGSCTNCGALRAQVAQLTAQNNRLNQIIDRQRQLLFGLRGEVLATVKFIDHDQDEPMTPRKRFVPTIRARLVAAVDNADRGDHD
jgi:hypothetical protein